MYEWSNWVFVCRLCNWIKSNQWLADGYVDPRAEWADERPERYFAFDTASGALISKRDHQAKRCQRAGLMTGDLNLNAFYHLKNRPHMLDVINFALGRCNEDSDPFSSFARAVLEERGFEIVN